LWARDSWKGSKNRILNKQVTELKSNKIKESNEANTALHTQRRWG